MLEFEKKILRDGTNFTGDTIPNITRGADWVFFHCDLIKRRATDVASDVLHSFSTTDLQVSYPFRAEPRRLEYYPVNKLQSDSVGIRVSNGRNNTLVLNGVNGVLSNMIEEE